MMLRYCVGVMYLVSLCVCPPILQDMCIMEGGTCVPDNTACTGWVETYDRSCGDGVCCKPAPTTTNPEPAAPNNMTCGQITRVPRPGPMTRVVGGAPAPEGQWPWQVALVDTRGNQFCAGTLVSNVFVVTAAHCFETHTASDTEVVLGEHHLEYESGNEVRMKIHVVVTHTGYDTRDKSNDIAFLQLASHVDISGHYVRTACLSPPGAVWTPTDQCYVSGWGSTKSSSDGRHLQQKRVTLIDSASCTAAWGIDGNVTDNQLCAGDGTTGTCQGDSGGPLVCWRDGSFYLAGVTSFGHYTCDESGFPDVYTKITAYRDWMVDYMFLLITAT